MRLHSSPPWRAVEAGSRGARRSQRPSKQRGVAAAAKLRKREARKRRRQEEARARANVQPKKHARRVVPQPPKQKKTNKEVKKVVKKAKMKAPAKSRVVKRPKAIMLRDIMAPVKLARRRRAARVTRLAQAQKEQPAQEAPPAAETPEASQPEALPEQAAPDSASSRSSRQLLEALRTVLGVTDQAVTTEALLIRAAERISAPSPSRAPAPVAPEPKAAAPAPEPAAASPCKEEAADASKNAMGGQILPADRAKAAKVVQVADAGRPAESPRGAKFGAGVLPALPESREDESSSADSGEPVD